MANTTTSAGGPGVAVGDAKRRSSTSASAATQQLVHGRRDATHQLVDGRRHLGEFGVCNEPLLARLGVDAVATTYGVAALQQVGLCRSELPWPAGSVVGGEAPGWCRGQPPARHGWCCRERGMAAATVSSSELTALSRHSLCVGNFSLVVRRGRRGHSTVVLRENDVA